MKKLIPFLFLTSLCFAAGDFTIHQGSGGGDVVISQSSSGGGGGSGTVTSVSAGPGLTGGTITTSGTLSLNPGTTDFIWQTNTLQTGSTFYVSSGTVQTYFSVGYPDGAGGGKIVFNTAENGDTPVLKLIQNVAGAPAGLIYFNSSVGTSALIGRSSAGFYIQQATSGTSGYAVTRYFFDSNSPQAQFNPNNQGFLLNEASMTFIQSASGLRPTLTWPNIGELRLKDGNLYVVSSITIEGLLKIPNSSTHTVTTRGEIAIDTDVWSSTMGGIVGYDGTQKFFVIGTTGTCADGQIPKFSGSTGKWSCQPDGGGAGGGVTSITTSGTGLVTNGGSTPIISLISGGTVYIQNTNVLQSGASYYVSSGSINGTLDVSSATIWKSIQIGDSIRDLANNRLILFSTMSSAVNFFVVQNSTTGGNPVLISSGADTNINLGLTTQGTGGIVLITSTTVQQSSMSGGMVFNNAQSSTTAGDFTIRGASNTVLFYTNSRQDQVYIGSQPTTTSRLYVQSNNNQINTTMYISTVQSGITAADTFIDFRDDTGSEGSVAGTATPGLLAYNTFTGSHYTIVIDPLDLFPLALLCSIGDKIDSWPSDRFIDTQVNVGPVYGLYFESADQVPANGITTITDPIVIDSQSIQALPIGAIALTDGKNSYFGFDLSKVNGITYFPVLDARGSQYVYQATDTVKVFHREASTKAQLFKTRVCNSPRDKSAIGVYGGTDNIGRDLILSIGTGQAKIFNNGQNIEIGDYLISSAQSGDMEKQADDIYHNYTVAKSMENVIWGPGETERIINVIYEGG